MARQSAGITGDFAVRRVGGDVYEIQYAGQARPGAGRVRPFVPLMFDMGGVRVGLVLHPLRDLDADRS